MTHHQRKYISSLLHTEFTISKAILGQTVVTSYKLIMNGDTEAWENCKIKVTEA